MSAKKRLSATILTAIAVVSFTAVSTQPAHAALSCQTGYNYNGWAWGKCTQSQPGGNNYRVVALCQNRVTGYAYYKYGDIRSVYEQNPSMINGCDSWIDRFIGSPRTQTIWG